jgi:putative sterol carrier protein
MKGESSAAVRFYSETVPTQFNAILAAQRDAGERDAKALRIFETMSSVNTTLCAQVRGDSESRFVLNIDKGVMTSGDSASHPPLLTMIVDDDSLEAFSRASGNSVLGFLAGLAGLGDEMKLTSQRVENLRLLSGTFYFELSGAGGFSLTFRFGTVEDSKDPDCSLFMNEDTYRQLRAGEIDAQDAFMKELVRIEGDMELAIQLAFAALAPDDS